MNATPLPLSDRQLPHPWLLLLGGAAVLAIGALVWLVPVLGLAVLLVVPLTLVMFAWPNLPTLGVIFLLYLNAPVVAMYFHGVPYAAAAGFPLVLAIPLAYFILLKRQKVIVDRTVPWILVFLAVLFISAAFSNESPMALRSVLESAIEGFCLYFLIVNTVRTPELLRRVTWALLLAGAFLGGLSALQVATHSYSNNYGGFAQMDAGPGQSADVGAGDDSSGRRVGGPLGASNRYAQIMLMLVPLGLFRFWGERSWRLRLLAAAMTAVVALGVALTLSRGAAVGFVILLGIVVYMRYVTVGQAALLVALGAGVVLAIPSYRDRLMTLGALAGTVQAGSGGMDEADNSLRGRYTENVAALLMYSEHPLVGVGAGTYPAQYMKYEKMVVDGRFRNKPREPHSLYLGLAAEVGTLGLAAFLAVVFTVVRRLVRARRQVARVRPGLAHMPAAYLLALIAYLTTGLFLHYTFVRYFWLMLALATAAALISLEEASAGPPAERDGPMAQQPA